LKQAFGSDIIVDIMKKSLTDRVCRLLKNVFLSGNGPKVKPKSAQLPAMASEK
jgi:hypothetical protein